MRFWPILNSNFVIFLLGFFFVTIFGTWLSDRFQDESWRRQSALEAERRAYEWEREKKFQLLHYRLNEGVSALDRIAEAMNARLFRLQRAFDELGTKRTTEGDSWKRYRDAVDTWNTKLNLFEIDLGRLVGEDFQRELNNYESDRYHKEGCPERPPSIHAKFWCANTALNRLGGCKDCAERGALLSSLAAQIVALDYQIDDFVARAGGEFARRSAALDEFNFDGQ